MLQFICTLILLWILWNVFRFWRRVRSYTKPFRDFAKARRREERRRSGSPRAAGSKGRGRPVSPVAAMRLYAVDVEYTEISVGEPEAEASTRIRYTESQVSDAEWEDIINTDR